MSRLARKPLIIPANVKVELKDSSIHVTGKKGDFILPINPAVKLVIENNTVTVQPKKKAHPMVGTTVKLLGNMIKGVHEGFEKKLVLVGVGYRAKVQGNALELSLGFSHPVKYPIPKGITIETPTNTEITIKGADAQMVGEIAAKIRAVRSPEPYKGKGVRYSNEVVIIKETKKK